MEIEKYIFIAFYIFILCWGLCMFATMLVWRTEDNLKQSVPGINFRLGAKCLKLPIFLPLRLCTGITGVTHHHPSCHATLF